MTAAASAQEHVGARPLEGQVAVVTGGGSGIGEATCLRLARDGATVVVLDVNGETAALTAALCEGHAVQADVSVSARMDEVAAEVVDRYGRLDAWVNNAGVAGSDDYRAGIAERSRRRLQEAAAGGVVTELGALLGVDDAEWRRMLAVHLDGTFFGMRAATRAMARLRSGAIVNIASICGIEGCEDHPHYSAAKAGVIGLTRAAARELSGLGIRVNAVAPGYIDTPMAKGMAEEALDAVRATIPVGRMGRPDEIAAAVAFLLSDDASYLVGQVLSPNGGILTA